MTGPLCIGDPDGVPESGVWEPDYWCNASPVERIKMILDADMKALVRSATWGPSAPALEWLSEPDDPAALLGPMKPQEWSRTDEAGDDQC